jgi:photosystem II stability/assembly factor-like uncharacterized protein
MYNFLKTSVLILLICTYQYSNSEDKETSEFAIISPLADKSLLLAADQVNSLSVIAGERGHILYSFNNENWMQASVETKATLTNIFMHDENKGWAVGHDAVILKSVDGAKTWVKIFSDSNENAPLLDLHFKDDLNGIAIGAYSLVYVTEDGGLNWKQAELNISSNEENEESEFFDFHLNDIAYAGEERFYIAAEAGHLLRTNDGGISWTILPSPYQGSFFGVLPLSLNHVLAYGLRGHLYRSLDGGDTWKKIETSSNKMLTDALLLSTGDIIVVGLSGTILLSQDNGNTFASVDFPHRYGLSTILEMDGNLVLAGEAGIIKLSLDRLTVNK